MDTAIYKIGLLLEDNELILTDGCGQWDGDTYIPNNALNSHNQEELTKALLGGDGLNHYWCFVSTGTGALKAGYPIPLLEGSLQQARMAHKEHFQGKHVAPFNTEGWFLLRDVLLQIMGILEEDKPLPYEEWYID